MRVTGGEMAKHHQNNGKLRAVVEVAVNRRVEVIFDDDGIVCIEDQAVDHARDALGLALGDDMDVRRVRCFKHY